MVGDENGEQAATRWWSRREGRIRLRQGISASRQMAVTACFGANKPRSDVDHAPGEPIKRFTRRIHMNIHELQTPRKYMTKAASAENRVDIIGGITAEVHEHRQIQPPTTKNN